MKNLTADEKMKMFCGKDTWSVETNGGKIPNVRVADGPAGVRKYYFNAEGKEVLTQNTAYPCASVIANSWNDEICEEVGSAIADECIEHDIDVLLAPAINIKRTPICGRNFEYFSEDPILAGRMGAAYIRGVQKKDVGTSLKHFAANNLEKDRLFMSSEVDERTLHEIYLKGFEIALKEKPSTVMCSYNRVNGEHASQNKYLLTEVLRKEFGFEGVILSDWWAVHQPVKALKAGLNLQMPYADFTYPALKEAYERGEITDKELDDFTKPIIELAERSETNRKKRKVTLDDVSRHQIAVKAAEEGIVLLKNDNILPLKDGKLTVIGELNEGRASVGGGSGTVNVKNKIPFLSECLKKDMPDSKIDYVKGFQFVGANISLDNFVTAIEYATASDYVVLCVGNIDCVESEGFDREHIKLSPKQEEMILQTAKSNPNIIVALFAGSTIDMTAWIDKVKAVALVGFGGEGMNEALSRMLCGKVCPSGKINETYPKCIEDTPTYHFEGNSHVDRYTEGIMVGYRHYDTKNIDVLFPFGYGLSYAKFSYSDLKVEKSNDYNYKVTFSIENTSDIDGAEIAQLYISDLNSFLFRPDKELKDYKKVSLKAGEKKWVTFSLNFDSFSAYSPCQRKWIVEDGLFDILIGASSRDILLKSRIDIKKS